ncbi:hypothetical protein QQ008_00165 [Fulvivirgaceae bacterium BMA10]|uniref:Peptidase M10 metallopeptidase domain-containing protein n=1 Tax=Splendidivirga corallicola TaxID=3051826 RepID=A0ABT8KGB5_9BACT|nr:hypothetical protein [Fulvivirgaceae bacterium BMA10]
MAIFLLGCEKEKTPISTSENIPDVVKEYVDRFRLEASVRGIEISTKHLTIEFEDGLAGNNGTPASGSCTFNDERTITIVKLDTTKIWWKFSDMLREAVIFHELGHCLLSRSHLDDELPDGTPKSMMHSSDISFYVLSPHENKTFRRDYYLDELFHGGAEEPCWANNNVDTGFNITVVGNFQSNVHRDHQSVIWTTSFQSLHKYQNGFMTTIDEINSNLPLISNVKIALDRFDSLWVWGKTDDGFIIAKHKNENEFEIVYNHLSLPNGPFDVRVFNIDSRDQLWFGNFEGLIKISNTGIVKHFNQDNSSLPKDPVVTISSDGNGNVYYVSGNNFIHNPGDDSFEIFNSNNSILPRQGLNKMLPHKEGVYISSRARLFFYDKDGSFRRIDMIRANMPQSRINYLGHNPQGNIVLGTEHGLRVMDENERISNYCEYYFGEARKDIISLVFEDNHTIWASTFQDFFKVELQR